METEQAIKQEVKPLKADALPAIKEGKIIIRNIPFDLKESHIKKDFTKYGTIKEINIPVKNENNLNRGFCFVEYATKDEAQKVVETLNGQKYKGRAVSVEMSAPSRKYEHRV